MIADALIWLQQVVGTERFDLIELIAVSLLVWVVARGYDGGKS